MKIARIIPDPTPTEIADRREILRQQADELLKKRPTIVLPKIHPESVLESIDNPRKSRKKKKARRRRGVSKSR